MPPPNRRPRHVVEDEDEEEQRPRQRQRRADPESDGEDSEEEVDEEVDEEEARRDAAESPDAQLVKKLVRYALACDFSRTPIRRDGIKEKVLGDQGRAFRRVFEGAQKTLRQVFGMEMVELPVKDKLTKEEKRKAAKSQNKSNNSNAYILVSMLPGPYKTARIIAPSRNISADEEAAYVAFYTLVISLIRINGGELSEPMLRRYLRRLNAEKHTFGSTKTEDTLAKLLRQGYLVKSIEKEARQHGEDDTATTWYIGPRGKIEVSDEAVAGLVREVWGREGQDEELEAKLHASLVISERDMQAPDGDAEGEEEEEEATRGDDSRISEVYDEDNGGPSRRRSGRR